MLKKYAVLLDPAGSDGGGGEFETKMLAGVETLQKSHTELKSRYQKVVEDLDRSDKEVKKAMEELTLVKAKANTSFEEVMKKYDALQKSIALNARSSFTDPIQRALANDETKAFINAAARAVVFPGEYNKLPGEWRKLLEEAGAATKSLTGVDSSLGQATVPTQTFNEIYDTLLEYGDWSGLGVIRVGMRTTVLPVATARPGYYWIGAGTGGSGESTAITEGSFTGSSVSLLIQTLAVYLTVARELLADSTVDLSSYILKQMAQSMSYGLDYTAFASAGAASQADAGYYGIFNAGAVNASAIASATGGNTTVGATELEDWLRCLTTVNPVVLKRPAKWWMNPQILAKCCLIRDKQGRPLFQTMLEAPVGKEGGIGSILGYPVVSVAAAPSTDAAGAKVAVFGDPEGQAVGIRADLELATSDDIKFAENMRAFRALMRVGVKQRSSGATLVPFSVLTLPAQ